MLLKWGNKKGKTGSTMFIQVLLVQIWLFFNLNLKLWRVEDSNWLSCNPTKQYILPIIIK